MIWIFLIDVIDYGDYGDYLFNHVNELYLCRWRNCKIIQMYVHVLLLSASTPSLKFAYNAKKEYNLDELTPESWFELTNK